MSYRFPTPFDGLRLREDEGAIVHLVEPRFPGDPDEVFAYLWVGNVEPDGERPRSAVCAKVFTGDPALISRAAATSGRFVLNVTTLGTPRDCRGASPGCEAGISG